MAHHVYTTPGFIVHSQPSGEAGKYILVFTRDLGMIGCTAQGVRLSQSKLRYYTQDYFFGLFSVVRGKDVWRMTGAKEIEGVGEVKEDNFKLWVRVLTLLKRLLPGEEVNEKLFEILEKFYKFLCSEVKEKELVEYVTVLRILDSLGYTSNQLFLMNILSTTDLNEQIINEAKISKDEILEEINNGLKESQL
jgi:DNA repair protein RecO